MVSDCFCFRNGVLHSTTFEEIQKVEVLIGFLVRSWQTVAHWPNPLVFVNKVLSEYSHISFAYGGFCKMVAKPSHDSVCKAYKV